MGFSPGLMAGLLNANTALGQAQVHQRTSSHLESRAQILETEIRSGHGDIEGKKAELEEVQERQTAVRDMQMESLNAASAELGASLAPDTDDKTQDANDKKPASDKAKEEGSKLQENNKETSVAAVDYKNGMHVGEAGKTNVAVSPEFLEKMADSKPLSQLYDQYVHQMAVISDETSQTGPGAPVSQTWAVSGDGTISYHAVTANAQDAQAYEPVRQQIDAAGRDAFGEAFGGVHVQPASPAQNPDSVGLLVSMSV